VLEASAFSFAILTEMTLGKTLDEVMAFTDAALVEVRGGLPRVEFCCFDSPADAFYNAFNNYGKKDS
jgi:hypothetical protein